LTACLLLKDCIVQTTSLPAYGRKFLPPRWSPDNKATGLRPDNSAAVLHAYSRRYMGAARLQWHWVCAQVTALLQSLAVAGYQTACMKAHCCPDAVAGYQTAGTRWLLPCCSGRIPNCMHTVAVVLLQWQDTKLHAHGGCCPAAVAGYQTACMKAHCCPDAVAGYQTACARGCPAAVAVYKLLYCVKDEQTCNSTATATATTKQDIYPRSFASSRR
jgi:hypothetical protein